MTIQTNGGSLTTTQKAMIRNYGEVWFHPKAITNVLSLTNVENKGFCVTYDTADGQDGFVVHKPNGKKLLFRKHRKGLHFHHTKERHLTLVTTVQETSEGYSQQQIRKAKVAREFQAKVGHPSTADLKTIVQVPLITNCPISPADIDRAELIYGPSVPILKGKTVRTTPEPVVLDYIAVPPSILKVNKQITLFGDLFFVNQHPFFTTLSNHIKFTTAQEVTSRTKQQLVPALKKVRDIYTA